MTKRKTTPVTRTVADVGAGSPSSETDSRPRIRADAVRRADVGTIRRALDDLGIDKPYYSARVVGGRLELALYGGDIVFYPEAASEAKRSPSSPQKGS